MVEKNDFGKAFVLAGTSAGYFLLAAGLACMFYRLEALFLVLIGGFMAFTYSRAYINIDLKRVRFANMLFGIFPSGGWVTISPDMQLGVKRIKTLYTTYSRGNRQNNVERLEFKVILYTAQNSPLMALATFHTLEQAKAEADRLIAALGVQPYVV